MWGLVALLEIRALRIGHQLKVHWMFLAAQSRAMRWMAKLFLKSIKSFLPLKLQRIWIQFVLYMWWGYFSSCWFEQCKVLIMEHIAFWWRSCNTARRFSVLQPWGCKFLEFSSEWSPSRMIVARPNLMVIQTMLINGFNIQIFVQLIEGSYLYLLSSFGFEICPALHLCVASSILHPLSLVQSGLHAYVHAALKKISLK